MKYFPVKQAIVAVALSIGVGLATAGVARAQHGDVWLSTDAANNKIAVGVVDEAGVTFTPGARVLEAILTPDALPFSPFDYSAEDPGFRSAAGELPANQPVGLTLQSLSVWNGVGLDPAAGVAFSFDLSGGLGTEANGSLHGHPLFGLTDLTLDALPLPDGVYVASFKASMAGLADSDPYYFVMLKDELIADETDVETLEGLLDDYANGGPQPVFGGKNFAFFEEAVEFVDGVVPEPSSATLLVAGAAWGLASARRRKLA